MPKRCVMIVLDGIGDRYQAILGDRTPLQAARTPVLDALARRGANGMYHPTFPGQACPSELAHFALFGYTAEEFPGRGLLEALGAGLEVHPGDVLVLAHLAHVVERDAALYLERDPLHLEADEAGPLLAAIARRDVQGVELRLTPTHGVHGILALRGGATRWMTDTNPMAEGRPLSEVEALHTHAQDPATLRGARALKEYLVWAHQTLVDHPVNRRRTVRGLPPADGVLTQRAGSPAPLEPFHERTGLRGASVATGLVYRGLANHLGLSCPPVADSDDCGADLAERLQLATRLLTDGSCDFVHVHSKAPDETAHRKDPEAKMRAIEALDRGLGRALEPLLADPETLILVTADHSTPSSGSLIHSGEPVPVILCGAGLRRDGVTRFDEVSACAGSLGWLRGRELLFTLLNHLDRAKLAGTMDTPRDQPYWPGHVTPFRLPRAPVS